MHKKAYSEQLSDLFTTPIVTCGRGAFIYIGCVKKLANLLENDIMSVEFLGYFKIRRFNTRGFFDYETLYKMHFK